MTTPWSATVWATTNAEDMSMHRMLITSIVVVRLVAAGGAFAAPVEIAYGKDPKQSLAVYAPAAQGNDRPLPVVIWVHGGGWRHGDKDNRAGMHLCQTWADASPLVHARRNPELCPPFVIAAVRQRLEAVRESEILDAALPSSTLVVVDYPRLGQLAAHGMIARDLVDLDNSLTKRLLAFVHDTPPSP